MATCDAATTEVKQIQRNSAQAAFTQATTDYIACLSVSERVDDAFKREDAKFKAATSEFEQLDHMGRFLLRQLGRETGGDSTIGSLTDIAEREISDVEKKIEETKAQIRKERRRFLDSDPQGTVSVAGLYFTKVPDNQVLIAFLSCLGAFLLFVTLLIVMNRIPIPYFQGLMMGERLKTVAVLWVGTLLLTWAGLFAFT
jgi:hypothetical protein